MNEHPPCQAYPPVPNWYTSHCAAVSDPHYYVYATRNMIVVLDLSAFRFIRAFIASQDKIQAIAAHKQFCFVGSTNGTIRSWSLLNGSLLITYHGHSAEVTVIKCIRDGMVIVSGDKSGKIIVQETFQKDKQVISKVNSEVRSLAPLHHAGNDYLAVGYANGMIHVEKIGTDLTAETMYQLSHSDGDGIHSLSWQPPSPAFPDIFPLLASSTRKLKNAIIWNVTEEARYTELKLPVPSPHWTDQQRNTIWFELAWSPAQEDEIYVTSYMGMVVQYKLHGRKVVEIGRFRDLHSRIAFSFTWVQNGRYAVTYSIDKQIILWDVKQRDAVCRMLTHAGYIYSLDIPTWNPGQAAVGLGDSNIKIWNFMDNSGLSGQRHNFYESRILWKGLQGQILKVRWHPTRENILAYSTEYGRVGVYDTSSNKCHQFKTYYNTKGSISISWASDIQIGETFVRDAIISCGPNNIAYAFDVKQPTAKAVNVTDWIRQVNPAWSTIMEAKVKTSRCCAAVDPQSRFLALGNTDGAVEVYRLDTFRIVYVANSQQTAVKVLSWRDGSAGSTLLAVGYNSGTITIHNIAEQLYDAPEVPIPNTTPMHTITEHKKRITGLAWSHHQERSLLASTANDEFAYVFDIQNGSAVSCFDQHLSNVLSVCWSAEDMDTLFTGGEDKFCYVWKYTDYPYTTQKNRVPRKTKELQAMNVSSEEHQQKQQASSSKRQESLPVTDATSPTKRRKTGGTVGGASGPKLNELMSSLKRSSNICRQPQLLRHCIHLAARIYGGDINEAVKVVKNRIPGDIDQAEYEYAVYAEQELGGDTQDEQDEDSKNLGLFFDDKNAMRELIGIEVNSCGPRPAAVADSYDGRLLLDIIQSNYKAFESSPVNWVALALSPMAGKETWLSLMETQAKHLVKQSQPVLAATCFLACSKIYDAIRVYREAAMYREAIALAKLRLPEEDPIISTLFAEWADRLQKKATQEELAAMCFLHAKSPGSSVNAINLLVRRKKESYMFWAACLAVLLQDSTAEERISQYLQMLHERLAKKSTAEVEVEVEAKAVVPS